MAAAKPVITDGTQPALQSLVGRKVKILKMHQATNLNGHVTSSIGAKQEKVDMTVTPLGILCKYQTLKGEEIEKLIFANNVYEVELA